MKKISSAFSQLAFVYPWIVEVSLNLNVRLAVTSLCHPKQFCMPTVTYILWTVPFHIECKIHERAFNSKQRRLKGFVDPEHSRWPSLFYNSGDHLENKDSQAGTDSPWGFRGRVALSPSNYIFALTTMRIKTLPLDNRFLNIHKIQKVTNV